MARPRAVHLPGTMKSSMPAHSGGNSAYTNLRSGAPGTECWAMDISDCRRFPWGSGCVCLYPAAFMSSVCLIYFVLSINVSSVVMDDDGHGGKSQRTRE